MSSNTKSKINIYISSKHREQDETTSSFKCIIPDGLLKCQSDEQFTLNVNCFYVYNTFYNCNSNYNHFQIQFYPNYIDSLFASYDFYLTTGNPNVYDLLNNLNNLLSNYCTITYDKIKNMFVFTRIYPLSNDYFKMYLVCINAGQFLGFKNNLLIHIPFVPTYSTNSINVNTIQAINIAISGDIAFNYNNIDNFYNKWNNSDIIIQKAVDVPKNGLIKYENIDGGDSFQYWLASNNNSITSFKLNVYDQDMNPIIDFPDYYIHIQFNIKEILQNNELLEKNIEYSKHNFLILGYIYDILNGFYKKYLI